MDFKILSSCANELEEWWKYFKKIKNKGIYHQPDYIKFLEKNYYKDAEAELFISGNDQNYVYYPYFKRNLAQLNLKTEKLDLSKYYDIVSSWYYGGPLINSSSVPHNRLTEKFLLSFNDHCLESNIITGFDRLDPNLKNHVLYEKKEEKPIKNRLTVYVDLSKDEETIWQELKDSLKRNIRKARNNNIEIENFQDEKDIKDFWEIYDSEMVRKNAPQRLRFSLEFVLNLLQSLPKNIDLLLAKHKKRTVGGFVIAFNGSIAHHFLSASLPDFWDKRVNDILYYSVILHTKKMMCQIFDFQGGREGVFRFKSKFSPSRNTFYTSSSVYDVKTYEYLIKICERAGIDTKRNYFPEYRAQT